MLSFDNPRLVAELGRMEPALASLFALSCTMRLANDVFGMEPDSPGSRALAAARENVSKHLLAGHPIDIDEAGLLALIRQEDDDGSFEAAVLEDALAAMAYTVRSIADDTPQNAAWAAARAYETADRFVSGTIAGTQYTAPVEREILLHPIVQRELMRQERDVLTLLIPGAGGDAAKALSMLSGENEAVLGGLV
jgi:hypothetical protein